VTDGQLVNLGLQSVDGVAIREEMFKPSGMSSRRRDMTDSEKERLIPITLAPDEKIKLQPGTTLVYTDEDDRIIRTELIGPQVARVRGIPGVKLYTDPNPDNQDAVDARMRQWEIDFGPISSDQRQARGRGSQPDRTAREQGRPRATSEDPIDRILRETEEARGGRGMSSRIDELREIRKAKEKLNAVSQSEELDVDEDNDDDDDDGLTPKERAAEKGRMAAYEEFRKITPEEHARRAEMQRALKESARSPEAIERRRLRRVGMLKGKESATFNFDGTLKTDEERKLYRERQGMGSRTTTLEKLSDEEILTLARRKGISEENLKNLYITIVNARDLIRRRKNEPLSHAPGLGEENARRMRDSIRIEIAPNGVPMIIAEPFQAVIDEVPDKRDWSKVVAPSLEEMQRLIDAVREARDSDLPILEKLSEKSLKRVLDAAYRAPGPSGVDVPFHAIKARVLAKLGSSEDEWGPISGGVSNLWVVTYLKGLARPESMATKPLSAGIHDFFGHFGVGRGFDRHGEWAAALVTDSLIRDHPAFDFLTPNEREWLRREFFNAAAGALTRLSSQLDTEYERRFGKSRTPKKARVVNGVVTYEPTAGYTPEEMDVEKLFDDILDVIYDEFPPHYAKEARPHLSMDAILDALGVPPSTTRPEARNGAQGMASTRSSRNSIPFTEASDELLLSIAGNEAAIKKERSIRNISGMSSRTDTYAILDGRDFEEILDELELNETEKDIARQALLQIYENENNSTFATRQKAIDEIKNLLSDNPTTPIDEKTKKAIESISIKISSNGIPVIFAQPHPNLVSILPDRDFSQIEAPSVDYLKKIIPSLVNRFGKEQNRYEMRWDIDNTIYYVNSDGIRVEDPIKKFQSQLRNIMEKAMGPNGEDVRLDGSWIQQYVGLLLNPGASPNIPDVEHDILGHFGTGRGFDRHGEWANAMAITSIILDSDLLQLNEYERNALAFWWLAEYGVAQILSQLDPQNLADNKELWDSIGQLGMLYGGLNMTFDGSARELISILDGENLNRESARSKSTRSIRLTEASPELLLRAEKEASRDRSKFVLESTLENLSSRPDKNEIISGMSSRNRLTDEQKQQMLEMLTDGMGDSEIVKKLGVTRGVVRQFRINNNIPPTGRNRLTEEQTEQVFQMLAYGMSDTQIAEKLGVTRGAIRNHRINNNIPANLNPGEGRKGRWGKAGMPASVVARNEKIIALYKLGKVDTEIARELGVSVYAVWKFRTTEGLPTNTYRKWNSPGELGQGRSKNE
jgi:DNA-binding NarL/FixJ family response regulator